MGLKGGDTGAKAYLRKHAPSAFKEFESMYDAREFLKVSRMQTAVIIDGNVLLMALPQTAQTLKACVSIIYSQLEHFLGTGWLTIIVFDEPAAMTQAKKLEQAKRDAANQARQVVVSEDLELPQKDDYNREFLENCADVIPLRSNRATRSRLYDEIIRKVYEKLEERVVQWNASSNPDHKTAIVFDGVDLRGCDRPPFAEREVAMKGNLDDVVAALKRDVATGEGDLKIQLLDERLRSNAFFEDTKLILQSTVDTDSLVISTLGVARRRVALEANKANDKDDKDDKDDENVAPRAVHSLLCMRSPPTKRQREHNPSARATYLCCDVALLEGKLQEMIWGEGVIVPAKKALHAMQMLAAVSALAGCDFVEQRGARFDHMMESISGFVKHNPSSLRQFGSAVAAPADEESRVKACASLQTMTICASEAMANKPRYKKQSELVANTGDDTLRKAIWTTRYWGLNEEVADASWGFFPPPPPPTSAASGDDD